MKAQLDRFSKPLKKYLKRKRSADLLDDVGSLARRRPEMVVGGLFLILGLTAAGVILALSRRRAEYYSVSPLDEFAEPGMQATGQMVTPAPVAAVPSEASRIPPSTSPSGMVDPLADDSSFGGGLSSTWP